VASQPRLFGRLVASWPQAEIALGAGRRLSLGATLGSGTFSNVYAATLTLPFGLTRVVAAKVFRLPGSDDHEPATAVVRRAAQTLALVNHPNVVELLELGIFDGHPLLVCELVDGLSLRRLNDWFAELHRRMPLDLALFVGVEIAEGINGVRLAKNPKGMQLGAAHLDLSPKDVLLSRNGEVKVGGFGLGGIRQLESSVQSNSTLAARAGYLSPEIACGDRGDARSDVFTLGVMLREMLVGPRMPANVAGTEAVRLAREGYIHPVTFEPQLPPSVKAVLDRALEPEPKDRFPHAGAMAFELRRAALALGVGDGRMALRSMLAKERDEEITNEVCIPAIPVHPADDEY
jgi:serine/threonine protein kinase